mmetsp:Transcript_37001/g.56710  ORF Transcript_37001/g.56710 Transcript_37001/m.56710 type:complete len:193 (-) Transcript_37001:858-1436(-)
MGGTIPLEVELDSILEDEEHKLEELPDLDLGEDKMDSNDPALLFDQLQEKISEIDVLKERLEKEKELGAFLEKQVADMTEAVRISEDRTKGAIESRDSLAEKNKDLCSEIEKKQDANEDMKLKVQEMVAKLENLTTENGQYTKTSQVLQAKLDDILDKNFLIEKKEDHYEESLSKEVRKLHFDLQAKAQVIE